ncbi:uncharacterized protein LOC114862494 isoform X2 [Betta splendens]|uniref:Uncharacterized protein LOC114862494 isoform X2 n=1 Tax=Betta splendens TaxID=158456 RepID=A0A6P7NL67_BETSP|nr:uncharacterized protein LOC114862494 isoform X2 [Betta splendens]
MKCSCEKNSTSAKEDHRSHVDMRRYRWPGYETQLLKELQRQQNATQFCDTLLQTEGISVPAHSCVLAALSPYLSRKLSASPSPAPGQKRLLQLQPVKAGTLLKLVGLLYSGSLQVDGDEEQRDVLAVAHVFGIKELAGGGEGGTMEEEFREKMRLLGSFRENSSRAGGESRKMQDAEVQVEMAGSGDVDSPNCMATGHCFTSGCAPSVFHRVEVPSVSRPQSITTDEEFGFSSGPIAPIVTYRALNDATATSGRPTTSASPSNTMTFAHSRGDDTNPTEEQTQQRSEEHCESLQEKEENTGLEGKRIGPTLDSREATDGPRRAKNVESGNSTEKRNPRSNVGKNLANMKQMQMLETTQISIKVKLRRRTKGEVWEVVSQQDAEETLTVLASHKKDGFNRKRLQKNLPPCIVEPDILNLPPHPNTCCGCQTPSCDFNLNQKDDLASTSCAQHQESDEQIEKLLEDIMMGLNILPNVEKEVRKSHDPEQGLVGALTSGQVPATLNMPECGQVRPAVSVPGCTFCQDLGTSSCHSVSATGTKPSLETPKPPDSSLSVIQLDSVQQLQCIADGTCCESASLSKSQECLHEESRTKSVTHQEAPGQDTEHIQHAHASNRPLYMSDRGSQKTLDAYGFLLVPSLA